MNKKIIKALLKGFARLPLPALYLFSDFITSVLYHFVRYRRKVVRQNLSNSFPEKQPKELKRIEKSYYRYLGDQMVETLKLINISDKELQKRVRVINAEAVNEVNGAGKNAVLFLGHYGNWEWVQEITRYFLPEVFMTTIYHPMSSAFWDELFLEIRGRWHSHLNEMSKAPRVLINKQNQPWVCGFIADGWTYHKNDNNWIDFLNQKTWFIFGSEEIGRKVGAEFFYLEMKRKSRGHYDIIFHKIEPEDMTVPFPYTRAFWQEFEKTIRANPPYWLWSHKRWK